MKVTVLYFGRAAELAGRRREEREGPDAWTVGELLQELSLSYPGLKDLMPYLSVAVNETYGSREHVLRDGDEVALLPPVSGGEGPRVALREEPLSVDEAISLVARRETGAVVTFLGTVRSRTGEKETLALHYEAYGSMALKEMAAIAREAEERWKGVAVAILHRVGTLEPGETAVIVAAASPHRPEAFAAARYCIDQLKERVPIWKKEIRPGGVEEWSRLP
ncbi:MAG: molybdenum cofactor biosynthesis protein MoaE [Clostridiales bacterium]|nr:molybdenum cofactor biosynthesis protein MoaE [Clostridiales bacterium]